MHATDASANDEHVAARLPEDARGDALELSIILHSASDDHEVCLEELHRGGDVAVGSERLREQGAELSAKQVRARARSTVALMSSVPFAGTGMTASVDPYPTRSAAASSARSERSEPS